jgi:predicted enzyme related to lactoylglutathione lyase
MFFVDPRNLCQLLIEASNMEASLLFYEKVFGWKAIPVEMRDLWVLQVPNECHFGIALIQKKLTHKQNQSHRIKVVFSVDRGAEIASSCQTYGGISSPAIHYPGHGLFWDIKDPDGVTWGLFQKESRIQSEDS